MSVDITVYADAPTAQPYRDHLDARAVAYSYADPTPRDAATGSPDVSTARVVIGDTTLEQPTLDELDRWLERYELVPREIHEEPGRYVLPLLGGDAFITYVDRGPERVITYSEVPRARRGQGLGAELSRKTLDALIAANQPAAFSCGYVAGVADAYEPWQSFVASAP